MSRYVLGIDQSTQGTKALLFDQEGNLLGREDLSHRQIIDSQGWVEHDPEEIYQNTLAVVKNLIMKLEIEKSDIKAVGISNQRETTLVWDKVTGQPIYNAIVWQCTRGAAICQDIEAKGYQETIRMKTGLQLSPYFSAAKIAWVLQNIDGAMEKAQSGKLACGTIDSWLIYKLTGGSRFQTDYSNASRTQLFNINHLCWDEEICQVFSIPPECLAKVTDSNGDYGTTDFGGFLDQAVPICGVMGDSHAALFGQGCVNPGMTKATYGTGSSVMMNIGEKPFFLKNVVTSLAWGRDGKVNYVLEGNINYTGAVISWLKNDVQLIHSASETECLARSANPADCTYLVPAFTGLGAPYWDDKAKAVISGITRTTGKAEIVRAALDCIAYQVTDVIREMNRGARIEVSSLRVDGGPTQNGYLMQFQSDMAGIPVEIPFLEELSGVGVAYMAGIVQGIYDYQSVLEKIERKKYLPIMEKEKREAKYQLWQAAVSKTLTT